MRGTSIAASRCWVPSRLPYSSRPLLQGSGLLSVDKRDSEPGPAVCIWDLKVRRSEHHCAALVVFLVAVGDMHAVMWKDKVQCFNCVQSDAYITRR